MQYTTLYRNIDASIMPLFVNTTHIVHMSVHFAFSLSPHCNYLPILNSYFVCRNSPVNAHCLVSMRSSSSNCYLQKSCSNSSLKNIELLEKEVCSVEVHVSSFFTELSSLIRPYFVVIQSFRFTSRIRRII